jgi:hypothetical protein
MTQSTVPTGYSNIATGQLAVTATAQPLKSSYLGASYILIKAPKANSITVYIGGAGVTDATGYALDPGDFVPVPANAVNGLYAIASTTGATITWLALS